MAQDRSEWRTLTLVLRTPGTMRIKLVSIHTALPFLIETTSIISTEKFPSLFVNIMSSVLWHNWL